jgi:hypothetical protein
MPWGFGVFAAEARSNQDNGIYQLAMVPLLGWEDMEALDTTGVHPASNESTVINLSHKDAGENKQPVIYATLMLWKASGEEWTDEELVPVKRISRSETDSNIVVLFNDGSKKTLLQKEIESDFVRPN